MSYRETRGGRCRRIALLMACAVPLALALPGAAMAQDESAARNFSIPAGPLSAALQAYSAQTGIQLVYSSSLVDGIQSPGVSGRMSAAEALGRLLAGTGLGGSLSGNTATIGGASTDGERVTGVVSVEGVQGSPYFGGAGQAAGVNGTNGSRDITATEGTGSFTSGALTIGSKVPQALKDVPQSISVLTSERLEQQNVTDFTSAMAKLPGITLTQGSTSLDNIFYSRGFAITSIQVDGGAPLSTSYGFSPQIDMSIFDHVELLRGADGQFGAYGDPSGSINLVRKKPLDHSQFTIDAQLGSWQDYRVVADATSPLALDGALRGRLIMTYQDNDHFYDTAHDNKALIYGIAELDATPSTLLTAGVDYTRQESVPWQAGLPRYQTGGDLKLPRSTCLCFDWNRWDFETTEVFGGFEQKIGNDWTAKFNLTYNRQTSATKLGYSSGAVNPQSPTNAGPRLLGAYTDAVSAQFSTEATLAGAFELFGQRQEITIGINRVSTDGSGGKGYASLIASSASAPYQPYPGGPKFCTTVSACPSGLASPPINVFDFDPSNPNYTEPRNPLATYIYRANGQTQSSAYLHLRLTAFDRLHLTTGMHWSRYEHEVGADSLCTSLTSDCADKQMGDVYYSYDNKYHKDDISWPPAVNLSYDISKSLTVYAGYTDIYISQADDLGGDLKPMNPVTGSNWEMGVKWAANGGKLNLSIAAYRINQKGFAYDDNADRYDYDNLDEANGVFYYVIADDGTRIANGEVAPGVTCCYVADTTVFRSQGIDFEAAGEIKRGWQISASYTYDETSYRTPSDDSVIGLPFRSIQPKHNYKLWTSYDFKAAGYRGFLAGVAVSAGINGQSSGYRQGTACKDDFIVTNATTGVASCPSKVIDDESVPGSYSYSFTVPGYVVVSSRIDYRISDTWSLAINLENILDKTYYQSVGGGTSSGNWYGAPRSYTVSIRAKW